MASQITEVEFNSGRIKCRALYLGPEDEVLTSKNGAPLIVLGHGFGATRDAGLEPYARRFSTAGMHALIFDYRHFGASDGEPRQLLSIRRQLQDWSAAVDFGRTLKGVDPERIALFGSSFSGGHVVEVAVRDGHVAAVVAQCPMMDGFAALRNFVGYAGLWAVLRLTWCGFRDLGRSLTGRRPFMVPIIGPPGRLAAMSTPDAEPGYRAIVPDGWRNEVCARISLTIGMYRPGMKANSLNCPILIQICDKDSVAPAGAGEETARRAGSLASVKHYPIGHFDIYVGDNFERSVADQLEFLTNALTIET